MFRTNRRRVYSWAIEVLSISGCTVSVARWFVRVALVLVRVALRAFFMSHAVMSYEVPRKVYATRYLLGGTFYMHSYFAAGASFCTVGGMGVGASFT